MSNKRVVKGRPNNRLRLLFVEDYFRTRVGQVVATADIMADFLDEYPAEYKGNAESSYKYIYEDIKAINEHYGDIIEPVRGKGFRMVERLDGISETEIAMLNTTISKSRSINRTDKEVLKRKLDPSGAGAQAEPAGRTTAQNIEWIKEAIGSKEKPPKIITFDYVIQEKTADMEFLRGLEKKIKPVRAIPFYISKNLSMNAYDFETGRCEWFSLEKVERVRITKDPIEIDVKKIREDYFNAYYAEGENFVVADLEAPKNILDDLIKWFGAPISQHNTPGKEDSCIIQMKIENRKKKYLYSQLYFVDDLRIIGPDSLIEEYKEFMLAKIEKYR